jgi:hypothetical protein
LICRNKDTIQRKPIKSCYIFSRKNRGNRSYFSLHLYITLKRDKNK